MSNQVKIKQVESYKDSQVDTIVCRGKLVLVLLNGCDVNLREQINENNTIIKKIEIDDYKAHLGKRVEVNRYKPIIISETEEIKIGDKALHCDYKCKVEDNYFLIVECTISNKESIQEHWNKILVLSEQFSPKQLQAIVDGKLKEQDEVFIECEKIEDFEIAKMFWINQIKLNNNHIKLFSVKQEENWDDIHKRFRTESDRYNANNTTYHNIMEYLTWLKSNYSPPQKL